MFDIFYIGTKPNLFPHEQQVKSIEQAQQQSRTRFFWMVSYLVDYTGFDFLYEPPPWQANQRHASNTNATALIDRSISVTRLGQYGRPSIQNESDQVSKDHRLHLCPLVAPLRVV
jgi:hypothetical protein